VELSYQSFKARSANSFVFHPYYLKEYRNRWFVLGIKNKNAPVMTLALDRVAEIKESGVKYLEQKKFQVGEYFQHVIGVTVEPNSPPEEVVLFADRETAPYIITKPLHHSQKILDTQPNGVTLSIQVQLNFELEREILGFGDRIKVISPDRLKRRIKEKFEHALDLYQYEFSNSSLPNMLKKLECKGFAILRHVYSRKEINQMKNHLHLYSTTFPNKELHALRALLTEIPEMRELIFNENLARILKRMNPELYLTKAIFFDKTPESNWYVTWHQDTTINVESKTESPGYAGWTKKEGFYGVNPPDEILKNALTIRIHLDDTDEANGALKVIPGSQNKKLSDQEIQIIAQNSIPFVCELEAGAIHLMRPLLLHASSKSANQKHRRVLHLEFNSSLLPNELKWAEK